jgi:alginate O-acetyltransferase complex protein AlgI
MNNFIPDYIKSILTYSEGSPIIFTGLYFWVFFTLIFAGYCLVHKKITLRSFYLFLASLFFYYKTSGLFFLLLLFTITSDFFIGRKLHKTEKQSLRNILIALSVSLNLLVLGYFKYAYFFTSSFNEMFETDFQVLNYFALFANQFGEGGFDIDKIILPVGISFYTFQAISYTADIYRRKLKPLNSIVDFGFYVSFFPQLVAGPIVRAADFIPQIQKPYSISGYQFGLAIFMILTGLIKKMVVGDYLAVQFIDKVFDNPLIFTGLENAMAVFGYSLQVYLDFSGYTDIAIGIALLMGFRLNTNFNSPYKATNTGEFWKRWHISLSTWLKDYLYIPLGGNRKGTMGSYILTAIILTFFLFLSAKFWLFYYFAGASLLVVLLCKLFPALKKHVDTNINLMITMLLGGLWHGSTWNFVIWGGLNGIGLVVYKYWRKISPWEKFHNPAARAWKILLTFTFITFTRIWFRSPDSETANQVKNKVFYDLDLSVAGDVFGNFKLLIAIWCAAMIVHWLPVGFKRKYRSWFIKSPVWVKVMAVIATVFLIWQTMSAELQPFIYFQF